MRSLTDKQQAVWAFIVERLQESGTFPTFPEIQQEFGLRSPNSVTQRVNALVKKKYLTKVEWGTYEVHPSKRSEIPGITPGIPVKGRIAAGAMHEAISENLGHLPVEIHPAKSDYYFALIVDGESMTGADIADGDYIIIDPREPGDGEIGAILYNGETTLKTIRKRRDGITLQPENQDYDPIEITPEEWEQIQVFGTYVGKAWKENGHWGLVFRSG